MKRFCLLVLLLTSFIFYSCMSISIKGNPIDFQRITMTEVDVFEYWQEDTYYVQVIQLDPVLLDEELGPYFLKQLKSAPLFTSDSGPEEDLDHGIEYLHGWRYYHQTPQVDLLGITYSSKFRDGIAVFSLEYDQKKFTSLMLMTEEIFPITTFNGYSIYGKKGEESLAITDNKKQLFQGKYEFLNASLDLQSFEKVSAGKKPSFYVSPPQTGTCVFFHLDIEKYQKYTTLKKSGLYYFALASGKLPEKIQFSITIIENDLLFEFAAVTDNTNEFQLRKMYTFFLRENEFYNVVEIEPEYTRESWGAMFTTRIGKNKIFSK